MTSNVAPSRPIRSVFTCLIALVLCRCSDSQGRLIQMLIHKIHQLLDGQVALLAADFSQKLREGQRRLKMLLNNGAQHYGIQRFQAQFGEEQRSAAHRLASNPSRGKAPASVAST